MGTSEPLVFQHFPTKQELYNAILDEVATRRHFADLEELLYYEADYPLEQALFLLARGFVEKACADDPVLRLILYAALERDALVTSLVDEHLKRLAEYVAYEITEGQAAGRLAGGDARALGHQFFATLFGLAVWHGVVAPGTATPEEIAAAAHLHVETFLAALRPSEE
jgi:AcrR family transcriptional regulator